MSEITCKIHNSTVHDTHSETCAEQLEAELKTAREQVESLKYLQDISKKQYDKALAEIERKDRALRYVNEKTAPSNNVNIMPFWMHSIEKIREVIREAMHPKGE